MAVAAYSTFLWNMTCIMVEIYRRFGGWYCLRLKCKRVLYSWFEVNFDISHSENRVSHLLRRFIIN